MIAVGGGGIFFFFFLGRESSFVRSVANVQCFRAVSYCMAGAGGRGARGGLEKQRKAASCAHFGEVGFLARQAARRGKTAAFMSVRVQGGAWPTRGRTASAGGSRLLLKTQLGGRSCGVCPAQGPTGKDR